MEISVSGGTPNGVVTTQDGLRQHKGSCQNKQISTTSHSWKLHQQRQRDWTFEDIETSATTMSRPSTHFTIAHKYIYIRVYAQIRNRQSTEHCSQVLSVLMCIREVQGSSSRTACFSPQYLLHVAHITDLNPPQYQPHYHHILAAVFTIPIPICPIVVAEKTENLSVVSTIHRTL